jgi:hypothetical protein
MTIQGEIRRFYQRLTRGWDESDWWSLDYSFIKWITPRLKELRKNIKGYPSSLYTKYGGEMGIQNDAIDKLAFDNWKSILDEMILGFEINTDDLEYHSGKHSTDEKNIRLKKSLKLFVEWFDYLWD